MKTLVSRLLLFLIPFLVQAYLVFFYLLPKKLAVYGTNDDALIASFSTDPELGLDKDNWIFIKSLFSIPATYLQEFFPGLGVYGVLIALTIILSTSAFYLLFYFVPTNFLKLTYIVVYTIVVIVFGSIALINPTYTGAAIFSGAIGFALLLFTIISGKSRTIDLSILGTVLIGLSYLIRTESFLLTLGFYLILFGFYFLVNRKLKINFIKLIVPSLLFMLVFLINFGLDRNNYRSVEWQEFLNLNDLRHSLQLRTAEYYLDENLNQVDWSEENFDMFQKFSLFDDKILNQENLIKLVKASDSTRGPTSILNANISNELNFIQWSYFTYGGFDWILQLIVFLIFALIVTLGRRSINLVFYLLSIILISISFNLVFAVSYHLPPRLTFNFLFLVAISVMIMAISEVIKLESTSFPYKILSSLTTTALILFTYSQFPDEINAKIEVNKNDLKIFDSQENAVNELQTQNPEITLVGTGSRIVYYYQNPYKILKNVNSSDQLVISGWHNLSPISDKKISTQGFSSENFHEEILNNSNIYWIDSENAQELLQKYFQQYSASKVTVEDMGFLGDPFFRIYKISTQK